MSPLAPPIARNATFGAAPPALSPSLDLESEIIKLKHERNAVILAHYYQDSEIQDLADFVGDSLELSRRAAGTKADVIVFAGVHFMAETAKILNPSRQVLLPDIDAGCSLADGCPADQFAKFLERYPGHTVVSYINCSAAVKAMSDLICTSSNAARLVAQLPPDQPIVFAPDRNLGRYVTKQTGREMVCWPGTCIVHEQFSVKKIVQLRERHPNARLVAHPECEEPVLRMADFIGSTTALLKHVEASADSEFIIATEPGILHAMQRVAPGKLLIPAPPDGNCACNECPHMRKNTIEKLYLSLRDRTPEITLDADIARRALRPIERMLAMS
ncbi:MAG: quinolinate synthase NadA [Candidatus Acidiferrales bacterium]